MRLFALNNSKRYQTKTILFLLAYVIDINACFSFIFNVLGNHGFV